MELNFLAFHFSRFKNNLFDRFDITLGQFLENHCFNIEAVCDAASCGHPMLEHERTFVHGNGRIHVSTEEADEKVSSSYFFLPFSLFLSSNAPFFLLSLSLLFLSFFPSVQC
jgi:hypothetical protein